MIKMKWAFLFFKQAQLIKKIKKQRHNLLGIDSHQDQSNENARKR